MQPVNIVEEFSKLAFDHSEMYLAAYAECNGLDVNYHRNRIVELGQIVEAQLNTEAYCARYDADREFQDLEPVWD